MTERFELLEQLGKGGMGVVWKARDRETGQVVALKLLHHMYAEDPEYVARFEREVEIARRIDSPNVVRVHGYGRQGGQPYISMEWVDGESLRELVRRRGHLPWDEARALISQMLEGLAAAHAAGVLHRDVKPGNILLTRTGVAKVADFGISRAADLTRMTGSSTMLGTPAYMAPEGQEDARSDLYSVGCVLYELLAGRAPFEAESVHGVFRKHMVEAPDLSKVPAGSRELVGQLLAKAPGDRPSIAAILSATRNRPSAQPPIAVNGEPGGGNLNAPSGARVVKPTKPDPLQEIILSMDDHIRTLERHLKGTP